jgi:hypothetical protein
MISDERKIELFVACGLMAPPASKPGPGVRLVETTLVVVDGERVIRPSRRRAVEPLASSASWVGADGS